MTYGDSMGNDAYGDSMSNNTTTQAVGGPLVPQVPVWPRL